MKTTVVFIILTMMSLFVGHLEITCFPFHLYLHRWWLTIAFWMLIIGVLIFKFDHYIWEKTNDTKQTIERIK